MLTKQLLLLYTAKYAGRKTNKKTQTQIYKQRQIGTHTHTHTVRFMEIQTWIYRQTDSAVYIQQNLNLAFSTYFGSPCNALAI